MLLPPRMVFVHCYCDYARDRQGVYAILALILKLKGISILCSNLRDVCPIMRIAT
jgi:hypothetical protein